MVTGSDISETNNSTCGDDAPGLVAAGLTCDRLEMKFLVKAAQASRLRASLAEHLTDGKPGRSYRITNLYYDSPGFDCFNNWEQGLQSRRKLRIRRYDEAPREPAIFLEIKHTLNGRNSKRRIRMSLPEALATADGQLRKPAHGHIDREIRQMIDSLETQRACLLSYSRQAFTASFNSTGSALRVTFDSEVRYRFAALEAYPGVAADSLLLPPGTEVLEVKTPDACPAWLADLIAETGCRRAPSGKYCAAVLRHLRDPARDSKFKRSDFP